jgi:hypothetical protein
MGTQLYWFVGNEQALMENLILTIVYVPSYIGVVGNDQALMENLIVTIEWVPSYISATVLALQQPLYIESSNTSSIVFYLLPGLISTSSTI